MFVQTTIIFKDGSSRILNSSNAILDYNSKDKLTLRDKLEAIACDAGIPVSIRSRQGDNVLLEVNYAQQKQNVQPVEAEAATVDGLTARQLKRKHQYDWSTRLV